MSEWDLLHVEPAPGDPAAVRLTAQQYRRTADHAQDALDRLRGLESGFDGIGWTGEAARAVHQSLHLPIKDLGTLSESHRNAYDALAAFASTVEWIQSQARGALAQAKSAEKNRSDARAQEANAEAVRGAAASTASGQERKRILALNQTTAASLTGQDATAFAALAHQAELLRNTARAKASAAESTRNSARTRADQADQQLASLRAQARNLRHEFDVAVDRCVQALDGAADMAVQKSLLQRAQGIAADVVDVAHQGLASSELEFFLDALDMVASVAVIISIVFPPTAVIAGVIVLGLGVTVFVMRYFQACNGTIGWDEAALSGVSVVFGGLKVASKGAKVATTGAKVAKAKHLGPVETFKKANDAKLSDSNPQLWKTMQAVSTTFTKGNAVSLNAAVTVLEYGKKTADTVDQGARVVFGIQQGDGEGVAKVGLEIVSQATHIPADKALKVAEDFGDLVEDVKKR